MLSMEVLKYPSATLPNTKGGGHDPSHVLGGGRETKLIGIMEYLQKDRPTFKPHDLVMVVDGHDPLFHLPPKALFSRYRDIIKSSNDRLRTSVGLGPVRHGIVRNSIVISSPACSGPAASDQASVSEDPLLPGVILGPVEDMRRLFERVNSDQESDQGDPLALSCIFSDILVAQEAHRQSMSWWLYAAIPRIALWFSHRFGGEPSASDIPTNGAEYGITLDTKSLIISTPETLERRRCDSLGDMEKSIYGKASPHCRYLNDITPPFWTLDGALPQNDTSWYNQDLPYSPSAKSFPVLTQNSPTARPEQNTKIEGLNQWKRMWFHPHARALLDTHVFEPSTYMARIGTEKGEWTYWSRWAEKAGGRTEDGQWRKWDEFCGGEFAEELFRDGRGSWEDPRGGWTGGG